MFRGQERGAHLSSHLFTCLTCGHRVCVPAAVTVRSVKLVHVYVLLSTAAAPLHWKEAVEAAKSSDQHASCSPPRCYFSCIGEDTPGQTRTLQRLCLPAGLERVEEEGGLLCLDRCP